MKISRDSKNDIILTHCFDNELKTSNFNNNIKWLGKVLFYKLIMRGARIRCPRLTKEILTWHMEVNSIQSYELNIEKRHI